MSLHHRVVNLIAVFALVMLTSSRTSAELVRWEITSRQPYAEGRQFGATGAYERIAGKVHFELDPNAAPNALIVDLRYAPLNARGRVEFWGDLLILAPADLTKSNGTVLYDVNNRGNKTALSFFNNGDPGDGFLMQHGFTVVWSGWDGELLPNSDKLRMSPPVAKDHGKPLTGPVRCEIIANSLTKRMVVNWDAHGSYRPTEAGLKAATLTVRERPDDPRVPLARDKFQIHVTDLPSDSPTQLPKVELEFPDGLQPGLIYELIYEAQDPLVHGVCFAEVRDLIAALKHGGGDKHPFGEHSPQHFKRALGFGVSQSGRFLREFLQSGFNADEQGRIVFEGLMPHVAGGGLGSFNHRFAQPTRHVNQHDHHDYPGDRFPFTYGTQTDSLSGRTDGILKRATETKTVPKVMHTQSAGEYYTRSGSLVHTDPTGEHDAELPDTVRVYAFGGTQHGPAGWPPAKGVGKYFSNPGDYKPLLRALLLSMNDWVQDKKLPPPSLYPKIADGSLVRLDAAQKAFVTIPGVEFPKVVQQPPFLDFGPRWYSDRIPDVQPPVQKGQYQVLVPRPGTDGNETSSTLLPPDVAIPLGTHTGWNLRRADVGAENELVSLGGAYIPFAVTKKEREIAGDPRLSLEERYGTYKGYIDKLEAKCGELAREGYILRDDVPRIIRTQAERARPLFEQLSP
ncbi:MAG: hypothetical protein JWM11_6755 [Planctomycetaceae bacterium]|nr:hypothetical protein [Planctomycetaceae bacterium]